MIIFKPTVPFSIDYAAYGLESGLFVQASVYDVSSGTPVFDSVVVLTEIQEGLYVGTFTGVATKSYITISLVYTDGTYATIDTSKAPSAECYKSNDAPVAFIAINYGVYTQESDLFIAANLYNCTTGTAVFVSKTAMVHILGGVYFVALTGTADSCYEVLKLIYTDGTYVTVDTNWNAGSDSLQLFAGGSGGSSAVLILSANLRGQSLKAVLKETI